VTDMSRIVLTTFGSLGDLFPYLALARELQARGHEAIIATSRYYQERVESRGLKFRAVRPDGPEPDAACEALRRIMDPHRGSEYVIRGLMIPALRESYADILSAAQGADLLISHVLTFSTRLVAETLGIPWVATYLQPLGFFSAYDPPVLPQVPFLTRLRFLGPAFHRVLFGLAKRTCRSWTAPWSALRAEIGLPPISEHPLFDGQYSPFLNLALFSPLFAAPQPDWPGGTVVTGFPFDDPAGATTIAPELERFLESGAPPIVFTLGSSGMFDAQPFYEQSSAAARQLGRRAVLIVGEDRRNWPATLPDGVVTAEFAPFAELFPRAAAIVHAGGIGTTGLAMRSGCPMLIMPIAHDQFDNAAHAARLGVA
jgi:rhamnosyltransferase subunit B